MGLHGRALQTSSILNGKCVCIGALPHVHHLRVLLDRWCAICRHHRISQGLRQQGVSVFYPHLELAPLRQEIGLLGLQPVELKILGLQSVVGP